MVRGRREGDAMPLHDWTNRGGWDGLRTIWLTELARAIKPRLPAGFRVFLGTAPIVAAGLEPTDLPNLVVRAWPDEPPSGDGLAGATEPEVEVATLRVDPQLSLFVEWEG